MNKYKIFEFKGVVVLVLQVGENVEFYMNYKTSDFFFCVGYKANLADITIEHAICIWHQHFECVLDEENTVIAMNEKILNELEKRHETKKKRNCRCTKKRNRQ